MADARAVLPPRAAAAALAAVRKEMASARRRASRLYESRAFASPDRDEVASELTEVNEWAADLWTAAMALEKALVMAGEKKSDSPLFPLD